MGSERSSEGCRMNRTLADGLAPTAIQETDVELFFTRPQAFRPSRQ